MKRIFVVVHNGVTDVRSVPEGYNAEIIDLDALADDPVSKLGELSAEAKGLVADEHPHVIQIEEASPQNQCANCGRRWSESYLTEVKNLHQRVSPGEIMPSGECPVCGALCHPIEA